MPCTGWILWALPLSAFNRQLPWQTGQVAASLEGLYHQLNGHSRQRDLDFLYNQTTAELAAIANELRGDLQAATLLSPAMAGVVRQEMLLMHQGADPFAPAVLSAGNIDSLPGNRLWLRPVYSFSRFYGDDSFAQKATEADRFGFVAGYETATAITGLSLGVMGGYVHSKLEQGRDDADIDDLSLALYAMLRSEPWRVNGYFSAGLQQYDSERGIHSNTGGHTLKSDFNGHTLSGGVNVSYNLLPNNAAALRPYAGADICRIYQQGREESGHRTFALDVDSEDNTRVNLQAGLMLDYSPLPGMELSLLLGYQHVAQGLNPSLDATFINAGAPYFVIPSPDESRHLFNYGLQADMLIVEDVTLSASVLGQLGEGGYSIGGGLSVSWQW